MILTKEMNVLIVSHGYRLSSGGPAQDLRDYLKPKIHNLHYVDQPFPHADYKETHFFIFKDGELLNLRKSVPVVGPEWARYIQQFFFLFSFLLFSSTKYDLCFALDNHSILTTYLFRKINRIKKLIYYSIDYSPVRFKNPIMNYLYHLCDKLACKLSDINWVVAKHMIKGRQDNGVNLKDVSPFKEVPMGFHSEEVKVFPIRKVDIFQLVYMGTILEKQGLQLAIESLPKLLKDFPKIHLTIIGTGIYEEELKTLVNKLKLTKDVTFLGFVGDKRVMYQVLTSSAIGLAPYKPTEDSFSYYADPSKIKIYLGCGLPVITTNVTAFSKVVAEEKVGIVINYSTDSFYKAIKTLLKSSKEYQKYRNSAIRLSRYYDTNTILKNAIAHL